jgi:flavin reductase (DIM6/NTAB) family NADH-FMN oxidoreductase RutF
MPARRLAAMASPGGSGPVGPFPADIETDEERDTYDRMRRRALWTMPYGLYVVGSRAGERTNLMTLNWATQVSFEPKLLGIGVEKPALTHELVTAGGAFSLCTVDREDRAIVRKFTKPVEVDRTTMTANDFPFHDAPSGVPVLDRSPVWFDCDLRQAVDLGNHTFFIGEVTACGFQHDEETPVLRMEDTRMNYGG